MSGWRRPDRRGTAAIEFALAFPVLLLAFLAVFELYRLVAAQRTLDYAVDLALRYGAVNSASASAGQIGQVVTTAATALLGSADGAVVSTVGFSPSYAPGNILTVSVRYAWTPALLGTEFPPVTLTGSGSITVQN
ncbi:MAG: pilus assembly protein [Proteobacteria bacterium]|nr:pilus assembly protein [Pseudomonadota bacterium]